MSTHVYLVSDQATPNISPALDPMIKPEKVILVVSPGMQKYGEGLKNVLTEGAGVKVTLWSVENAWDIEYVREQMMELLDAYENETLILNATGGTRPMSMAAFEVFRVWEKPVFYVHPETDELIWLYPRQRVSHQLADRVKLRHFLVARGTRVEERGTAQIPPAYRDLTARLILRINYFAKAIRTLNYYAYTAAETLRSRPLKTYDLKQDAFADLLTHFARANILARDGTRLRFPNESARFFANGGWLEQHVFAQLMQLRKEKPEIQDLAQSLEVSRSGKQQQHRIRNELDVAFLANNRLYIVECKTKYFGEYDHADSPGAETLYKIDTLKDLLGGLQGRGMLVSYLPLSRADRQRAQDLQIQVCDGERLQQLASVLRRWVN